MTINIASLTAEVQRTRGVEASVLALVSGLRDQVAALKAAADAAATDPAVQAQIDALVTQLADGAQPLADAVAANAPAPSTQPTPAPVDPSAPAGPELTATPDA